MREERINQNKIMSNPGFKLSATFYDQLLERLQEVRGLLNQGHRQSRNLTEGEGWLPNTLPTRQHLEEIIEIAFWTSLQVEEGRSLKFTIGYHPRFTSRETRDFHLCTLQSSIPFNLHSLRKLAPAVLNPSGAIKIGPSSGGNLEIWALTADVSAPFAIRVLDPGQLIVRFSGINIAAISGAEALLIRAPFLTRDSTIWSKFAPVEQGTDYSIYTDFRIDAILEVARAMRNLNHGGTLIIVPDNDEWKSSVEAPIPYLPNERFAIAELGLKKTEELRVEWGERWGTLQHRFFNLEEPARVLAQLSAVDGAVLITRNLELKGFGVKLKPSRSDLPSFAVIKVDPLDHNESSALVKMEELWGTRHQSAARFVYEQHEAIAIVASQDGNVTAFSWERTGDLGEEIQGRIVFAYQRLELTLF